MADKKISELVSLTGANAATGDLLPIVDISATETKKITRDEFFKNIPSIDINGGTIDGTVIGGSTPAAISGTTGSFSGNLTVDTNTLFVDAASNNVGIGTTSGGQKLSVNGNAIILAGNEQMFAGPSNTNVGSIKAPDDSGALAIQTNSTERMRIDASGMLNAYYGISVDGGTIKLDGNYPVGTANVALGDGALDAGSLSGGYNTALGTEALSANTTGGLNTAVGYQALFSNTTGLNNTAMGVESLENNTTAGDNSAFGLSSLRFNTTGANNTAVGSSALFSNTTASNNTAVGYLAGYSNTTGFNNTVMGYTALYSNTTGFNNVFLGRQTGYSNTTAAYNVAIGSPAMFSNTTGIQNVAVGDAAMYYNTTGNYNTALGSQALQSNTTASYNTAVGYRAGYLATGALNTYFGAQTGENTTTGTENLGAGASALYTNTTGSYNTAIGRAALAANTTASNNTAVGYQAGYSNTTGQYNAFFGRFAGNASTGSFNTYIGNGSGSIMTTGAQNTIIGGFSGNQGGLDIRTSNNNIVLSDGDGNPRANYDPSASRWNLGPNINRTFIATASVGDGASVGNNVSILFSGGILPGDGNSNPVDNSLNVGSGTYRWGTIFAATGTINTSDADAKQDVEDLSDAERRVAVRIKALVKKFRFKDAVTQKGDAARTHVGVIAQEVQAAFVAEGLDAARYGLFCSDTWYEVDGQGLDEDKKAYTQDTLGAVEKTRLGVRYEELLAFIIAAL